jgi:hypothetical protein
LYDLHATRQRPKALGSRAITALTSGEGHRGTRWRGGEEGRSALQPPGLGPTGLEGILWPGPPAPGLGLPHLRVSLARYSANVRTAWSSGAAEGRISSRTTPNFLCDRDKLDSALAMSSVCRQEGPCSALACLGPLTPPASFPAQHTVAPVTGSTCQAMLPTALAGGP